MRAFLEGEKGRFFIMPTGGVRNAGAPIFDIRDRNCHMIALSVDNTEISIEVGLRAAS